MGTQHSFTDSSRVETIKGFTQCGFSFSFFTDLFLIISSTAFLTYGMSCCADLLFGSSYLPGILSPSNGNLYLSSIIALTYLSGFNTSNQYLRNSGRWMLAAAVSFAWTSLYTPSVSSCSTAVSSSSFSAARLSLSAVVSSSAAYSANLSRLSLNFSSLDFVIIGDFLDCLIDRVLLSSLFLHSQFENSFSTSVGRGSCLKLLLECISLASSLLLLFPELPFDFLTFCSMPCRLPSGSFLMNEHNLLYYFHVQHVVILIR